MYRFKSLWLGLTFCRIQKCISHFLYTFPPTSLWMWPKIQNDTPFESFSLQQYAKQSTVFSPVIYDVLSHGDAVTICITVTGVMFLNVSDFYNCLDSRPHLTMRILFSHFYHKYLNRCLNIWIWSGKRNNVAAKLPSGVTIFNLQIQPKHKYYIEFSFRT